MKRFKYISKILAVIVFITAGSCTEDFLSEIKPETAQDVYSLRYYIDDLDVLVNGAYAALFSPAGMGTFQVNMELQSDFYYAEPGLRSAWITGREGNAYTRSYSNKDYDHQAQLLQWNNFAINLANTVIESLETGMVDNDPKKATDGDRVMGEAKFIRAYSHWQIAILMGAQYHSSTLNTPSGIFRDKPILGLSDIPKGISTVGEMYDLIIADLKDAQAKLPLSYDGIKHPARYVVGVRQDAATALLAKIYFQMNDFDKALVEVDKLLGPVSSTGSSKYPLTSVFADLFSLQGNQNFGPDQNKEMIYAAEGASAQKWTQASKWVYYRYARPLKDSSGAAVASAYGRIKLGTPLLALFNQADDIRFTQLIEKIGSNFWQKKLALAGSNVPIFRAPEFHLMRAEILARKDQNANAVIELNHSRVRAGLEPYLFTNKADLLKEIFDERGRELFGECVRFTDNLRRGAVDGTPVPMGQRDAADKSFIGDVDELPWNSPYFVYPMPTNEKDYNDALK
jgi:hypothetical protein